MSGFEATPVELQVCGSMLSQIEQELTAQMGSLQDEVDALLTGGWQGGAANGFADGWQQWSTGASELIGVLESMGELLAQTGRTYDLTDEDARRAVWQAGESL